VVKGSATFATPIVFATKEKPVLLIGLPGDIVTLTYTGVGGVAVTFDYGTGHRMGHGMRDLTITGPGNSTSTIGVIFGGMNGAEGIDFRDPGLWYESGVADHPRVPTCSCAAKTSRSCVGTPKRSGAVKHE
jgi:hypothetical protein